MLIYNYAKTINPNLLASKETVCFVDRGEAEGNNELLSGHKTHCFSWDIPGWQKSCWAKTSNSVLNEDKLNVTISFRFSYFPHMQNKIMLPVAMGYAGNITIFRSPRKDHLSN